MYANAVHICAPLDVQSVELISDLLYEIGKGLLDKNDFKAAVKWLEQAYSALSSHALDGLSRDTIELRPAIAQALVTALLSCGTNEAFAKAESFVAHLDSEMGDKMVVLLLRLDLLSKAPGEMFDSEAYAGIVTRMIRQFNPSDVPPPESSYKVILHHIRKLHEKAPALGCNLLDDLLRTRLLASERINWTERAIVTRVWMASTNRDAPETVEELDSVLTAVQESKDSPLTPDAAMAVQMVCAPLLCSRGSMFKVILTRRIIKLLMKRVESNFTQCRFEPAERWCQLALKETFMNCGPRNTAILYRYSTTPIRDEELRQLTRPDRKLMLCAFERNDYTKATEVYHSMPAETRSEQMTSYLAYRLALRNRDRSLATECLRSLCASSSIDMNFLYACVVEAKDSADHVVGYLAMKSVSEKCGDAPGNPTHLPALYRSSIRLLQKIQSSMEREDVGELDIPVELCTVFEKGIRFMYRSVIDALESSLAD